MFKLSFEGVWKLQDREGIGGVGKEEIYFRQRGQYIGEGRCMNGGVRGVDVEEYGVLFLVIVQRSVCLECRDEFVSQWLFRWVFVLIIQDFMR